MRIATVYTLKSQQVPVHDMASVIEVRRLLPLDQDLVPLQFRDGPPLFASKMDTVDLNLYSVFQHVGSAVNMLEPARERKPSDLHLFAIEPALEEILSAPFRDRYSRAENKLRETQSYLQEAESKRESLQKELSASQLKHSAAWDLFRTEEAKVISFYKQPLWRRLWIAFFSIRPYSGEQLDSNGNYSVQYPWR